MCGNFEIARYKVYMCYYLNFLVLLGGVLFDLDLVPKSNNVFSITPTTGKITKK